MLKNATIVVPLKYLSKFWRLFKMPLISCKVELKHWWTKHWVLSSTRVENNDVNSKKSIFTVKDTKLYFSVVSYQQQTRKKDQNFLAKKLKD